jgi:hypothetical protein
MIDKRLSLKAKGVFMEILSEYSNKIFTEHDFITPRDRYDSVHSALTRLEKNEYIKKLKTFKGYILSSSNISDNHSKNSGYIYCLTDGYENYKIGKTKDLELRLKQYRTSMPYGPVMIKILKYKNMDQQEKLLHSKFKDKRISGEWFKLSKKDLNYINSLRGDLDE